jgi:succinoglycan biosynthesis transport protein ExoP
MAADTYELRVRDLWDVIRRRRRIVTGAMAIGLTLGLAAALFRPTLYRASTTITMDKVPPIVVLSQPGFGSTSPQSSPDQETAIFPDVPGLVDLANGEPTKQAVLAKLAGVVGERQARAALARLHVKQVRQSQLLEITVDDPDRAVATATANTAAKVLIDMDLQSRRGRATELRQAIEQQLQTAIPKLKESEDALMAFKSLHGDVTLTNQTALSVNRLTALETQLADVRMQQQEARARIDASRARLASLSRVAPTQWVPSPLIAGLQSQLATQEIDLSGMRQLFTPKYPGIVAQQMKIDETKARLDAELARSVQANVYGVDPVYQQLLMQLRQDEVANAAYDAREKALSEAIRAYDDQVRLLPSRELEQVRLTRAAKQAEEVTQILSEKLQQARIAEASVGSAIRVVNPARLPEDPVRKGRWLSVALGAFVGLALGVGGAFAKERLEDPLKSADDVASVLQIPVLASVPRVTGHALSAGPAEGAVLRARARFAETFRYLRTNLLAQQSAGLYAWRTLLVTSPGPGDGKNTVAVNLAIAFAQAGRRVWLVECDLRDPVLETLIAFRDPASASGAGLGELLESERPAEAFLRPTTIENLWLLPAGTARERPAERLAGERMHEFLTRSHQAVDIVIAVAPPVLPVTDAATIAPWVDAVILVVHAGTTPREAAWKALQQLQAVGARVLGAVATGVACGGPGAYDNYYAGYYQDDPGPAWHFGFDGAERAGANAAGGRGAGLPSAARPEAPAAPAATDAAPGDSGPSAGAGH